MLFYWAAQIIGAALGALWIACLVPGLEIRSLGDGKFDGCFNPRSDLTLDQVFGWEALCTFMFILPIFSVVWYTNNKKGYGNTGPVMIGLSLFASALCAGPFTGAALNPARVLGSPIVFDCQNKKYIGHYIAGEITGAALVPLFIMPWYGIANNSWYGHLIPKRIMKHMKGYVTRLENENEETNKTDNEIP